MGINRLTAFLLFTVCLILTACQAPMQLENSDPEPQTITSYTGEMERMDGYFPVYWDDQSGRLLMEISRLDTDFLYLVTLATGTGTSSPRLDRGQTLDEYIARFVRKGPSVHLVLQNPSFVSTDEDHPELRQSVEESFVVSTVADFEILVEEEGRLLVNVTPYITRDAGDVAGRLQRSGQGNFRVNPNLSSIYLPRTDAFPENTEIEASLTFQTDSPGGNIRRHSPDGRSITLRQHHSFVKLPDSEGFTPRQFDPRIGFFSVSFYDFSKSFDEDYVTRYAVRHRLQKQDPEAEVSDPVEPIIYYLDRGVPEPYRTAFIEGAEWYNGLFEAAGFRDAFRVEDMPEEMNPMDARYNVIQWVHRSEPGPSVGPSFRDPRTGEIIRAAVRMDSYRSLTNYNLFAGMSPSLHASVMQETLSWLAEQNPEIDAEEFAMARRKQHSAHEVGHTLGLAHNFIAESYGRASVMDYPAPLVRLVDGKIDVSEAYSPGPGAYDTLAIRWGYTEFSESEEEEGLEAIIREGMERGLKFITNQDQAASGSNPYASTWTIAEDPWQELQDALEVRRHLMENFDETVIREGEPMWWLNQRFAPVYFYHRFDITALTKAIGGMEFRYALRGDPLEPTRVIPAGKQLEALELLLDVVESGHLAIPDHVLELMVPRTFGYWQGDRGIGSDAGHGFDQVGAARTLSEMVFSGILHPERVARVVNFADRYGDFPSLETMIGRMIERTWETPDYERPYLRRAVQRVLLDELMILASNPNASVEVRAAAEWGIIRIQTVIDEKTPDTPDAESFLSHTANDIDRFMNRIDPPTKRTEPLSPPPGTPIGSEVWMECVY